MNINIFQKNKEKIPNLSSFKKHNFDVDKYWSYLIIIFFILTLVLGGIGGKYAYSIYSGSYISKNYSPDFSNLIKEVRLKTTIEQRQDFINQEFVVLRDPSI